MSAVKAIAAKLARLEQQPLHRSGARVFRAAVGGTLLFRVVTELRYADVLWGHGGLGQGSQKQMLGQLLGGAVDGVLEQPFGPHLFLGLLGVAALGLLFGRYERLAGLAAWFVMLCLGNRLPELLDGGDNVAVLALFFSVLLLPRRSLTPGRTAIWIHNVGVGLIWFQICLLYFTAGTMKLGGGVWRDGTALYYISNVKWFSHPVAMSIFKYAVPATLAAYATMIHQIWFPVAVFTRLRLPWLLFGLTFHFAIAVFMGLITFSCFMIALELLLIDDAQFARISLGVRRLASWFRTRVGSGVALARRAR